MVILIMFLVDFGILVTLVMMTCERTIIDCSLSELAARRKLKESSDRDEFLNAEIEIVKEIVEVMRRPFLSKTERKLAENLPESVLREYFKPGEFIHLPMTREEKSLIDQFRKFNKRKDSKEEMCEDDFKLIAE